MDIRVVLYDYCMRMVGLPYRWSGDDPMSGFDCSGLVLEILEAAGVVGPEDMSASGLMAHFSETPTAGDFGTLAFFGTGHATHVGFCLNATQMLEAGGGGSHTLTLTDAEEQNAYIKIRPILHRKDFLGFRRPNYPWKNAS